MGGRELKKQPKISSAKPAPILRILGIETSCDETAAAITESGSKPLASVVASQIDFHAQYGGVFPEMASRQHILTIYSVIEQTMKQAHLSLQEIDAIAVTRGPGLPGSLVVGLNVAKGLALASGKPLIGIHHVEGHIYSAWVQTEEGADGKDLKEPEFPILALIVSGGHTSLVLISDHLTYRLLGQTLDDAAGEAFDKVARLLNLGYPGGPSIEKAAQRGNPKAFEFPRAVQKDAWNFSFSGLKTAVLYQIRKLEDKHISLPIADLAASFQQAVVEVLVGKTLNAAQTFEAKSIIVAGGVSANKALRQEFLSRSSIPVIFPPIELCTDNALMIACAGYYRYIRGQRDGLDMDAMPTWQLASIA